MPHRFFQLASLLAAMGATAALAEAPLPRAVEICPAQYETPAAITRHRFSASGKTFEYTAKAGTLLIRGDDQKPVANIGYTAYSRPLAKGERPRPVLFAFNGGPGSSSAWLHVGMLGPRRVLASDAGPTSISSLRIVDNEFGMLDKADVVMIDPVGTGIAHAVCGKKDSDFWSTDADAESVGRFIIQFLTDNGLWAAPKYILGESYGTARAAIVLNYLQAQRVSFDGVILLGTAMDMEALYHDLPGNDRPYSLFLPGFAATAWYHKLIPDSDRPLEPFLDEVRRFALGPMTTALMKGNALPEAERDAVAEQIHRYTSLSTDYIKASNLRISEFAFGQELMRREGKTVSRLDSRYIGPTQDLTERRVAYDPLLSYLGAAFTAAFNSYYRDELTAGAGGNYQMLNSDAGNLFVMTHRPIGVAGEQQPIVNAGVDLAHVMVQDPNLHVLVLAGYFDLGSTFTAAEYMINHLNIPASEKSRISMRYYRSGHMIYVNQPSLRQLKADMDQFIDMSR